MWEMWTCAPPYEELTKECHFSVLHFLDQVVKGARPPLDDDTAVSKAFPPHLRQLLRRYTSHLTSSDHAPCMYVVYVSLALDVMSVVCVDFRYLFRLLDGMFVFLK
jgi:hypothetical protein